jgi:hypothetical protein
MASIIDNSAPLGTSYLNLAIINSVPTQPYVTSNVLSNVLLNYITSNTLSNILTLKQDKLVSTSLLYGDGGNISGINWNNITLNKPTTFNPDLTNIYTKSQVDGIATLTNFYNKTSIDSSLSGKESVLSFSAPLTRSTNTIGIDLSLYDTISARNTALQPYINYTALNSCNFINASVSTLTNYSTTTAMTPRPGGDRSDAV